MTHFKTTWTHVRRSPYQALAAILIMMVTFMTISGFAFLILGSSRVISYFETQPKVEGFFKDDAKQESIDALKQDIEATHKVSMVRFIDKKEAFKIYQQQNKDPLLQDLVSADILPSSLQVSTYKIEDLPVIAKLFQQSPIVAQVTYQGDAVKGLTAWTSALRKIGIGLIIILSFTSILIMSTIVGIKISQKREEIEIMRLIGATKWYVSVPFVLEGIMYGAIGAFYGWAVSVVGLFYATPFLQSFLSSVPLLPVSWIFLLELLGGELLFAVFLGTVSSWIAVRRYLK